jgi:hypothetical protein
MDKVVLEDSVGEDGVIHAAYTGAGGCVWSAREANPASETGACSWRPPGITGRSGCLRVSLPP